MSEAADTAVAAVPTMVAAAAVNDAALTPIEQATPSITDVPLPVDAGITKEEPINTVNTTTEITAPAPAAEELPELTPELEAVAIKIQKVLRGRIGKVLTGGGIKKGVIARSTVATTTAEVDSGAEEISPAAVAPVCGTPEIESSPRSQLHIHTIERSSSPAEESMNQSLLNTSFTDLSLHMNSTEEVSTTATTMAPTPCTPSSKSSVSGENTATAEVVAASSPAPPSTAAVTAPSSSILSETKPPPQNNLRIPSPRNASGGSASIRTPSIGVSAHSADRRALVRGVPLLDPIQAAGVGIGVSVTNLASPKRPNRLSSPRSAQSPTSATAAASNATSSTSSNPSSTLLRPLPGSKVQDLLFGSQLLPDKRITVLGVSEKEMDMYDTTQPKAYVTLGVQEEAGGGIATAGSVAAAASNGGIHRMTRSQGQMDMLLAPIKIHGRSMSDAEAFNVANGAASPPVTTTTTEEAKIQSSPRDRGRSPSPDAPITRRDGPVTGKAAQILMGIHKTDGINEKKNKRGSLERKPPPNQRRMSPMLHTLKVDAELAILSSGGDATIGIGAVSSDPSSPTSLSSQSISSTSTSTSVLTPISSNHTPSKVYDKLGVTAKQLALFPNSQSRAFVKLGVSVPQTASALTNDSEHHMRHASEDEYAQKCSDEAQREAKEQEEEKLRKDKKQSSKKVNDVLLGGHKSQAANGGNVLTNSKSTPALINLKSKPKQSSKKVLDKLGISAKEISVFADSQAAYKRLGVFAEDLACIREVVRSVNGAAGVSGTGKRSSMKMTKLASTIVLNPKEPVIISPPEPLIDPLTNKPKSNATLVKPQSVLLGVNKRDGVGEKEQGRLGITKKERVNFSGSQGQKAYQKLGVYDTLEVQLSRKSVPAAGSGGLGSFNAGVGGVPSVRQEHLLTLHEMQQHNHGTSAGFTLSTSASAASILVKSSPRQSPKFSSRLTSTGSNGNSPSRTPQMSAQAGNKRTPLGLSMVNSKSTSSISLANAAIMATRLRKKQLAPLPVMQVRRKSASVAVDAPTTENGDAPAGVARVKSSPTSSPVQSKWSRVKTKLSVSTGNRAPTTSVAAPVANGTNSPSTSPSLQVSHLRAPSISANPLSQPNSANSNGSARSPSSLVPRSGTPTQLSSGGVLSTMGSKSIVSGRSPSQLKRRTLNTQQISSSIHVKHHSISLTQTNPLYELSSLMTLQGASTLSPEASPGGSGKASMVNSRTPSHVNMRGSMGANEFQNFQLLQTQK